MTTYEATEHSADTARLRVARDGGVVRVTWRGEMTGGDQRAFRAIVTDLVDGQGNLNVAIELADMVTVDVRLLDMLVEIEQRVAARGGQLSVSTRTASWRPACR